MNTTTTTAFIGKAKLTLVSDLGDNNELLDTQVRIGDTHLCVIAGEQRGEFLDELAALVGKYEI